MSELHVNWAKWNFKVVFNRSCCHGNYENLKFYVSIKIFHQYIFQLPSFSLWAATFLLPWFGKWHIFINCQNCVQTPEQETLERYQLSVEEKLPFISRTFRGAVQTTFKKILNRGKCDIFLEICWKNTQKVNLDVKTPNAFCFQF